MKEIQWTYNREQKIYHSKSSSGLFMSYTIIKKYNFISYFFILRIGKKHIGSFKKLSNAKLVANLLIYG